MKIPVVFVSLAIAATAGVVAFAKDIPGNQQKDTLIPCKDIGVCQRLERLESRLEKVEQFSEQNSQLMQRTTSTVENIDSKVAREIFVGLGDGVVVDAPDHTPEALAAKLCGSLGYSKGHAMAVSVRAKVRYVTSIVCNDRS